MTKQKRVFLIDGNCYAYRAFYAIKNLSSPSGQPVNAVYGFMTMLLKLLREENPDYLAVTFDLPAPTFRHREFAEYKANRPEMPGDLQSQMQLIKEIISAFYIPIFEQEGYEADDLLGTLARRAKEEGLTTFILTSDKDILQLVNSQVKVISPYREAEIRDAAKVRELYGLEPEQIPDLMGLSGDSSDNIPGVPGIGVKTASRLIQQFGNLENLLGNLEQVSREKQRKSLEEFSRQAVLSKRLATIDVEVPIEFNFEELRLKNPNEEAVREIFKKLGFKRLLERVNFKNAL